MISNAQSDELVLIVEEWCFECMRGVDLGGWPILPDEVEAWLFAIALHGRAENVEVLDIMSHRRQS